MVLLAIPRVRAGVWARVRWQEVSREVSRGEGRLRDSRGSLGRNRDWFLRGSPAA